MERKELTCIGCPMGCQISTALEGKEIISLSGNSCPVGDKYARTEVLHPERTVTSTAAVAGGLKDRVSVKTAGAIPKDLIFTCMKEINEIVVEAPVRIGDVIIESAAGSGIPVIATKNVERRTFHHPRKTV